MSLTGAPLLTWRNRNIPGILDIDGTNIYRSINTPLDPDNLPEPYDFVEGDQEFYADSNVELYNTYYYMIGVVGKGEEKLSNIIVEISIGKDLKKPMNISAIYYPSETSGDLRKSTNISSDFEPKSYTNNLGA